MRGFIQVTEIGGSNVLLQVSKIISVLECENGTFIETDIDRKGESSGVLVQERFDGIKFKILQCEV